MIDLHTHSTFSDGTTPPEENVALAAAAGLEGMALTDHDTMDGWERAERACGAVGIEFVPGLEFSCEAGGHSVHVLGYWVDPSHEGLRSECARLRGERARRCTQMLALLTEHGVTIDEESVYRHARGAPLGRPHIAAVLVERGIVPDLGTAFDRYIGDGGVAYVPKHALSPIRGVELLRAAGGVAVLAHPARSSPAVNVALVEAMAAAGLAGIEADHAGHDPDEVRHWRAIAQANGLLVTGSSDFHGDREESGVGERATSRAVVEQLRAHCRHVSV